MRANFVNSIFKFVIFFNVMTNVFLYCLCDAPRENQQCVDEASVFK